MNIKLAEVSDSARFVEHHERLINSSGPELVIFSPREKGEFRPTEADRKVFEQRWGRKLDEPGWERCFFYEESGRILGHVLLRAKNLRASLHRVDLQMGLEPEIRRKGLGTRLMEYALDWARKNTRAEWVDLGVFESNQKAFNLYRRFGFEVIGKTEDCFRVYGRSMNDLSMALKLR